MTITVGSTVGAVEAGPTRSLRVGLAAAVASVVASSAAVWWLMPRVAADPDTGGAVIASDWARPVMAIALVVIGSLVLLRDRRHRYGWLLVVTGVINAINPFLGLYALYGDRVVTGAELPLVTLAAWVQDASTWPGMAVNWLLVPALFPNGRAVAGRWGTALRVTLSSWVAYSLVMVLTIRPLENWYLFAPDAPMNPTGILPVPQDALNSWWGLTVVASLVVVLGTLLVRWRRASGDVRQQLKWPLFAFVLFGLVLLVYMTNTLLVYVLAMDVGAGPWIDVAAGTVLVLLPVGFALGVMRFRLWDVDRVINRTLVYGLLTAAVVAVYALGVVGVSRLLPSASEQGLALATTMVVAFAFDPGRRRLQAAANRWMFGQRDEPYAVLSRLGGAMAQSGAPAATLQRVVDTVATSLKLPWVAVELDQRDGHVVRAEHGRADITTDRMLSVPLVHHEEEVGRLLAAPRSLREPLSEADRRLLTDVAHQAGAVAATARLTQDLQQSREELVLAREEERRRIRRDLHDGLGPSLAAQTLALDAAADRIDEDPAATRRLLERLKRDTQQLVSDIRRLVHELRPPALDELGLAGALVAHVAQVDSAGTLAVRVRTDPDPLPDLSAAVEVAAYRVAREAVTNVLRHAEATRCDVTLRVAPDGLEVTVVDDGVGLPVVPGVGVGMRSMRERAEELGGTFHAGDATGGGTEVVATLPLVAGPGLERGPDTASETGVPGGPGRAELGRRSTEVTRG